MAIILPGLLLIIRYFQVSSEFKEAVRAAHHFDELFRKRPISEIPSSPSFNLTPYKECPAHPSSSERLSKWTSSLTPQVQDSSNKGRPVRSPGSPPLTTEIRMSLNSSTADNANWVAHASSLGDLGSRPYLTATSNISRSRKVKMVTRSSADHSHVPNPILAENLLAELGIQVMMDLWTTNMRTWLSRKILRNLLARIKSLDAYFEQLGYAAFKCGVLSEQNRQLLQRYAQDKHCFERLQVQRYLDIKEHPLCADYVVQRIAELANHSVALGSYCWDASGLLHKGRPLRDSLPSDPELLFHLFCTFMDIVTPSKPSSTQPFSSEYVSSGPIPSEDCTKDVCICRVRLAPAVHYRVAVRRNMSGGRDELWSLWEVAEGKKNLFHVLVLFVYFVQTRMSGQLGGLKLATSGVQLDYVLSATGSQKY
ncbi:transmembrane protein 209-like [Zophobas morio]|uniref:transmembrane protein 209-like n=1 Tax=Zophobas morio TaxID=2755281 RepID=UPI0030829207